MAITNTTLGTASTPIFISTATSAVTTIYFCNISAGPQSLTVYAVPAGATADNSTIIYYNIQIAPTDTFVLDTERLILDDMDSLVCSASQSNAIVATVSYVGV